MIAQFIIATKNYIANLNTYIKQYLNELDKLDKLLKLLTNNENNTPR